MATTQAPSPTPSDVSVMISYSRTDSEFAKRLRDDLKDAGFPTWMDTRDIPGGAEWKKEIHAGIDGAQVVLVVMSPAAMRSKWVRKEWTYAIQHSKVVIPLLYYPCDIPARLARHQTVDFRPNFFNADAYYAQQLVRLTETVAGYEALDPVNLALSKRRSHWDFGVRRNRVVSIFRKDRDRFLTKVATRYVNRLKPPFEGALWLTLGLAEDAQALARPALAMQENPEAHSRLLPVETPIAQLFQEAEGQLLILGAPGAGKSTLLYQLAQDLVGRAREDEAMPIPVVFNLASWAQSRKPLEDWMVDQLVETWQVPPHIARGWVDRREVAPLLDGLDEVLADAREACAAAINRYHHAHGLDLIAVCSRTADYYAQETRLDMQKTVVAQPLRPKQIDAYLASGSQNLVVLRDLAQVDADIQNLLSTPLLLSVVSLAYENVAQDAIPRPNNDRAAWMQTVFHDYVHHMLGRRGATREKIRRVQYSDAETTLYLAWLAAQMRAHGQVDAFYLENVQPAWLPNDQTRRVWRITVGLTAGLGAGLGMGLAAMLAIALDVLSGGMVGWVGALRGTLVLVLSAGLSMGLITGFRVSEVISLVSTVRWRLPSWYYMSAALVAGLLAGPLAGLVIGLLSGLFNRPGGIQVIWPLNGLVIWLPVGLGGALLYMLAYGLYVSEVDSRDVSIPNEGLMRSRRMGLFAGLLGGLIVGPGIVLLFWRYIGSPGGLPGALLGGPVIGSLFGLSSALPLGLLGYIQHQSLQRVLAHLRLIPRHYVAFLDFAADHVLLQRVGGGYRFVHALLLDYFADQWAMLSATEPPTK